MNLIRMSVAVAIGAAFSASVLARDAAGFDARDARQQERIAQGLKSGALTTGEAARLERSAAQINRMEAQALRDGVVTPQERARIEHAQDALGRAITRESNNAQTGDPNSASARRMQADARRKANQQRRIQSAEDTQSGSIYRRMHEEQARN